MIPYTDVAYKELIEFIKDITCGEYDIYNESAMTGVPRNKKRVGFMADSFLATGFTHNEMTESSDGKLHPKSTVLYHFQLTLFVYGKRQDINTTTGKLMGAFHNYGYRSQFIDKLYIKPQTMSLDNLQYSNNGVLEYVNAITIDCNVNISHGEEDMCNKHPLGYFTDVNYDVYKK